MTICISGLLLLAAWLQPLHIGPWMSWHSEVLAVLAGIVLVGWALHETKDRSASVPKIVVLPMLLLAVVWTQTLLGEARFHGDAIVATIYFMIVAGAIMAGYTASTLSSNKESKLDSKKYLIGISAVLVCGAIFSTAIATAQLYRVADGAAWMTPFDQVRRPGANMAQANHLATLLVMGIAAVFYCKAIKTIGWLVTIMLLCLLLWGVVLTESRGALLGLGLLWGWTLLSCRFTGRKTAISIVISSATCYVILLKVFETISPEVFFGGVAETGFEKSRVLSEMGNVGLRGAVWAQLLGAAMERPFTGWGIMGVSTALVASLDGSEVSGPFTYSHNAVIDLIIWFGLPISFLFLTVMLAWVFKRIRSVNCIDSWYCWAAVIPFVAHSLLEYPHAYAYFLVPVGYLIGFQEAKVSVGYVIQVQKRGLNCIFFAFLALCGWVVSEYVAIEEDYRVARAEALRIGDRPSDYKAPEILMLNQLEVLMVATRVVPRPLIPALELEALERASNKYPWTAIQNRYALALALNNKPLDAEKQLKIICAMHGSGAYKKIEAQWFSWAERYSELNFYVFADICKLK